MESSKLNDLTLQMEPSRVCNMNCSICMRSHIKEPQNNLLSFFNFQKICDVAVSSNMFKYIGLHGWGEPLFNPHLFDMIKYAKTNKLTTNLTTNGSLLDRRMDEIFASGLDEIAFGVYSPDLLINTLPKIKEFIIRRDHHGFNIKGYLDVTIFSNNLHLIPKFISIANKIGIDSIIFHRLFNIYKIDPSIQYISLKEELLLFKKLKDMAEEMEMEIYLPTRHSYPCRVVRRSIFVNVDGEVTPCCFLPEYTMGNILEVGMEELPDSKFYSFITENMHHPICKRCYW